MTENLLRLKQKVRPNNIAKIFLIALLFVAVLLPLLFIMIELGTVDFFKVITSSKFLQALGNSVSVSIVTSILSVGFSFALAYLINTSTCRFKNIFAVVITLPMLIPSISHGMGLIVLYGDNGILTSLFGGSSLIYGFLGVMLGSFMYSFPVAFLMFNDILKYEDRSVYDVADIMGVPKYRQFLDITLPYLKKPLISIFFAVFTMIFTDYGVAMMIGGRFITLPLFMYNEVIGQLNFGVGAIISLVLMLPAVIACIFDMSNKNVASNSTVKREYIIRSSKAKNTLCYTVGILSLIFVILPIVMFCIVGFVGKYPSDMSFTFGNFKKLIDMNLLQYIGNSLIIALVVSLLGVGISYTIAYFTARSKSNLLSKVLHIVSLLALAIPGVVLGISYSLMYGGTNLSRSIFVLVIINIVHFFSSPYLMGYNALGKINPNYELVAKTLHISKFRFIVDVLIPETEDTILEMFSYFFVNSMVTISAVSFLANTNTNPLALLINQMESQMLIECAAIISMLILVINIVVKLLVYTLKLIRRRKYA